MRGAAKRGALKDRLDSLQDLFISGGVKLPPRHKNQVVTGRMIFQLLHDAGPDPSFQPVSLDSVRQFLTDRYPDPEIPRAVPGIKKRKTVSRQSFSLHDRNELVVFSYSLVLSVCVGHHSHPARELHGETFSSFGPAAVDDVPARCGAHSLPEALRPLLLEIAFLCCCFRHRPAPLISDE
jgi:hypothetical protein